MSGQLKSPTITVDSLCENKECAMSVSLYVSAGGGSVIRWRSVNSDYSKERNKFNAYNIRSIYAIVGDGCVSDEIRQ